jgi:penicillin-binding protein 2
MPRKLIPTDPEQRLEPLGPVLRDDTKFPVGKIAFFQYLTVGVFLFLLSGFWALQVQNPDYYFDRAERNHIRSLPLLAPRGKILDREGRIIVDNHSSFSLILSRENLRQEHLKTICEGIHIDCNELADRLRRFDRTRPKYEPIVVKEELDPGELAFVEAHSGQDTFPEMERNHTPKRLYPRGGIAAHIIGYVGEVSEEELNTTEFARYKQGDLVGKAGVERQYNDILMGVDGQRRVIVDNRGNERKVIDNKEATPGKNITLTIDLDLQAVAELAMEDRRGAVVALDPRSGEVLAMVSRPAYDPNKFAGRIRSRDWSELVANPETPLLNRAVQAQLAPGSTFKPIVALAALTAGVIDGSTTAHCAGGGVYYNRYTKCHRTHGTVNLHSAMVGSCDVFFYNIGMRIGVDKVAEYATLAGLGAKTGIDLPGEEKGIVPSTKWKVRNYRQPWWAGETISVVVGQGALTVTPLQLAYAIGGLATGGNWYRPRLLRNADPEPPRHSDLDPAYLAAVLDGMYGVVNEGGTGAVARLPGITVCGKTGTAQLMSNELVKARRRTNPEESIKDNAWFVAFAPRENPEIAVAALWESGHHGNLSAPIVRDVIRAYFDKKARRQPPIAAASAPVD